MVGIALVRRAPGATERFGLSESRPRPQIPHAMTSTTRTTRKKWVRRIATVTILLLALCAYAFTQLNFPYYTHEKLAKLQARMGLHAAGETGDVQIIGHRGSGLANTELESDRAREREPIGNTRTAIGRAISAGADWIEVDLRRSKDGTLVLFHDETVDGKTDGEGKVSDLTVGRLQRLSISTEVGHAETILTLEEFGEEFLGPLVEKEIGLVLDVKQAGLKGAVLGWIERATEEGGLEPDKLVVFGEFEVLKEYAGEGLRLGYTLTWKRNGNRLLYLFRKGEIVSRLRELDADLLVVPVIFTTRSLVERAAENGFETWAYGSDDNRDWGRVSGLGVKGLIVDYPAAAIEHLYPGGDTRAKAGAGRGGR